MKRASGEKILVLGIGNPDRGDDGVGVFVSNKLKTQNWPHVKILENSGGGFALMEAWQGFDRVIVIDAVVSGAPAGAIHMWNPPADSIPAGFARGSTHSFGIAEAVEMAQALGKMPARLTVVGIEGTNFNPGDGLSPELKGAAERAVVQISKEIGTG